MPKASNTQNRKTKVAAGPGFLALFSFTGFVPLASDIGAVVEINNAKTASVANGQETRIFLNNERSRPQKEASERFSELIVFVFW